MAKKSKISAISGVARCRVQGTGCKVQGAGCKVQVASAEKQAIFDCQCFSSILEMAKKSKISAISGVARCKVQGARCKLQGAGCKVVWD